MIYIITGPPAAGKTTWMRQHAKPGDITIDYDSLAAALTPEPSFDPFEQPAYINTVVQAARDAATNEAWQQPCDVYVIHAMPARQDINRYRKHGAQIVTIDPGYEECARRAAEGRTPRQQAVVEDWYARRGLTV